MITKWPSLDKRKYKLNHFELKPSKEWVNMFILYYHKELVGFISQDTMNILRSGNVKTIFFWIREAEICNGHLTILKDNIGKILFVFNENKKDWKLKQITFTQVPGKFLPLTREIIIEKFK